MPVALPDPIELVLARQDAVARIEQLIAAGMTTADVAYQLHWGRWQRVGATVVVAHNGPLTPTQQEWAAVFEAGRRAALCGRSAATHHGLDGWHDGSIHVLVERGTSPPQTTLPLVIHESRRYRPSVDPHPVRVPPMTRAERSIVDAAAWTRHPRSACGLVIASVQQRVSNPERLLGELHEVGAVRHRRLLRSVLIDVEGGAHALSEVDFGRLCRRHQLPTPIRQSVRTDPQGRRRYVDVELRTRRGKRLLVEIDGAVHLIVGSYWSDMARANEIVISGHAVLRFPTVALYLDEAVVVDQLRRALFD
jgi:hypothetical protein